jgi:RimJ/RimL family protein N-acetyltransferase
MLLMVGSRMLIEVRPFASPEEYSAMIDYFLLAEESFLRKMGVDPTRLATRDDWLRQVLVDHDKPDGDKDRFYVAWILDGKQVGHSSINGIRIGEEAYLHLHLWQPELRKSGLGIQFLERSIDFYFEHFHFKRILCQPFAENPAPNRALVKLGFEFIKRYRTVPGSINYEQDVNLYELRRRSN